VTHWAFWVVLIGCGAFYGIQKQFEVPKLKALHQRPIDALRDYYVFLVFAVGGLVLAGAYWMYLHDIIWSVHAMVGRLRTLADAPTGENIAETLNNLAQGSALLPGALVAAATLIFTLLRTWINERTTRATEEGLITDRINAAVASLGADKTVKGIEDGKNTRTQMSKCGLGRFWRWSGSPSAAQMCISRLWKFCAPIFGKIPKKNENGRVRIFNSP